MNQRKYKNRCTGPKDIEGALLELCDAIACNDKRKVKNWHRDRKQTEYGGHMHTGMGFPVDLELGYCKWGAVR